MKIGIIHATTMAVKPIEEAFRNIAPEVKLLHFMDTGLVPMIQEIGGITPDILRRFSGLANMAQESSVSCIQLTCSAFNNSTDILQPMYTAKLFRSDEAMLDEALKFERIGLVSTMPETPAALISYLKGKRSDVEVSSVVNPEAFELVLKGKWDEHDRLVKKDIMSLDEKVDVIVLSQYSLAHLKDHVQTATPILSGPETSAERCIQYLQKRII